MSAVLCTVAFAAIWSVLMIAVWRSLPATHVYARLCIVFAGVVTVALILILGFTVSGYLDSTNKVTSHLSKAEIKDSAKQPHSVNEIIITVMTESLVQIDNDTIPLSKLKNALEAKAMPHAETLVTLVTKEKTSYDDVTAVLDICSNLGITKVSFSLDDK